MNKPWYYVRIVNKVHNIDIQTHCLGEIDEKKARRFIKKYVGKICDNISETQILRRYYNVGSWDLVWPKQ